MSVPTIILYASRFPAKLATIMVGPTQYGSDYFTQAALGYAPRVSLRIKTGRNRAIDTTTDPEDIWSGGGIYPGLPIAGIAETVSVVSTSANDTSDGTGARTIRIIGIGDDDNWLSQEETVALNGTTPVVTTTLWRRVEFMEVLTAGSGGSNAGRISVKHSTTTANVFIDCDIGDNRSAVCAWTIPGNKIAILAQITATSKTKLADIEMGFFYRPYGGTWQQLVSFTLTAESTNYLQNFVGGHKLYPKGDVVVRAISVTQVCDVSASFTVLQYDVI